MKSYLSLIPISAKIHRRQNRMILFCIVISVFLVTSVFSIADASLESERLGAIERHGNWHIKISGLSDFDAKQIALRTDIEATSWWETANYEVSETGMGAAGDDCTANGRKIALCGIQQPLIDTIMKYFSQDANIQAENNIILSADAKELLGVDTGDGVTLRTATGTYDFTVTGFRSNSSKWLGSNGGEGSALIVQQNEIGAFLSIDAFRRICEQEGWEPTASEYYIRFQNPSQTKKILSEIKHSSQVTDSMVEQNKMLMATLGQSDSAYVIYVYGLAAFLFLLILMAGVFMISGSLSSNIARRSQFFGMLRCIGASKQQIIRFVRAEALYWCKTAIPAGLLLGVAASCGLCAFIKYFIGGEFAYFRVFRVSAIGVLSGCLVGIITVLLAAQSPAKKASDVSPAAAASGSADGPHNIRRAANMRFFSIETVLGIHHATGAKKNLLLMTCSFALSIALFLCFSVLLDFVGYLMPQKSYAPNLSITGENYANAIDRSLAEELKKMPGVKEVYGRASVQDVPASFSKQTAQRTVDLISYDEVQLNWLEKDNDLKNGSDASKVIGDQNQVLSIYDKENPLEIGDVVQIGETDLTVAGILKNSPFSNDGTTDGTIDIICSKETLTRLTGETHYGILDIQLTKRATDENVTDLLTMARNMGLEFRDRREEADNSFYLAVRLIVWGFLSIVALISLFHMINSISMSVSARIRQYGAMRAVGMDGRQLTKTISVEAYTYVCCGFLFGCAIGLPASKLMYDYLITEHFGDSFRWELPAAQLLIILALMSAAVVISVRAPSRRLRQMAITDTINEL